MEYPLVEYKTDTMRGGVPQKELGMVLAFTREGTAIIVSKAGNLYQRPINQIHFKGFTEGLRWTATQLPLL